MGEMLSQAEINALLGNLGNTDSAPPAPEEDLDSLLSDIQKDVIGEVGNISMGTSATTLYALLGQKVDITTPQVRIMKWAQVADGYDRPCVGIRVDYTEGIEGSNILILKQSDVKVISSLMLGGTGLENIDGELTDLDLSAISEAMNQMVGSASTSMSSLVKMKIDIDTPRAFVLDWHDDSFLENIGLHEDIVVTISFRMQIGTMVDSNIMQVIPLSFALRITDIMQEGLFGTSVSSTPSAPEPAKASPAPTPAPQPQQMQGGYPQQPQNQQMPGYPPQMPYPQQGYPGQDMYAQQGYPQMPYPQYPPQQGQQPYPYPPYPYYPPYQQPVPPQEPQKRIDAQPVQFQSFDFSSASQPRENINIIMDVPLEVSVELGRTSKRIKDILEFAPGSIIELDKLAGEPIDVLVNGKFVAKGEVVVVEENFCIRITDIIKAEHRI